MCFAIVELDFHARAKGFHLRIAIVVAACPFGIFHRRNLVPKVHRVRPLGAFRSVAIDVMPLPVLQRDREDIHDAMIQRLPARFRVHLLRVVGSRADDVVRVVARMQRDAFDIARVFDFLAHAEREVDERLRLILRGVFLRVRFQDSAFALPWSGQRDFVGSVRPVEHVGDHAVFPFVDG